MKTPRIVVIGSINTDMVVHGNWIPMPGETVLGGCFQKNHGGKGANQAVAAARLGADVAFVGMVGQDVFGDEAIASLHGEGVDVRHVYRHPVSTTGVALVMVGEAGENMISVAPGANYELSPKEILMAEASIREADLVMLQLETPLDTVIYAAQMAQKYRVPVLLNPAPAMVLTHSLLGAVEWLTPNESEAERLTGIPVRDESSAREAAHQLMARGVGNVIVTLGARGALAVNVDQEVFMPAYPVRALDTTAAGDAFNAGLACALARGESLEGATRYGCQVAALSVMRLGAQASLPRAMDVEAFTTVG